ncbi:hypothetical protein QCA50_014095 [Cerrena zonata]|uniref:Uncharacterized protein n=1 Tax=Cerrena zonata TaxID=2478898 RepID=A0AAW0FTT5_9APHY
MPTLTQKKHRSKAAQGGTAPPQRGPVTRSSTKKNNIEAAPSEPPGSEQRACTPAEQEVSTPDQPIVDEDEDLYADPPERGGQSDINTQGGSGGIATPSPSVKQELRSVSGSGGIATPTPSVKQEVRSVSDKDSEATRIIEEAKGPAIESKLSTEEARNAIRPNLMPLATRMGRLANRQASNRVYAHIFNRLMTIQQDMDQMNEVQNNAVQEVLDILESVEGPIGVNGNSAVCDDPDDTNMPPLPEPLVTNLADAYATTAQPTVLGTVDYSLPSTDRGTHYGQRPSSTGVTVTPPRVPYGPDRYTRLMNANLPVVMGEHSIRIRALHAIPPSDSSSDPSSSSDHSSLPPPGRGGGDGGNGGRGSTPTSRNSDTPPPPDRRGGGGNGGGGGGGTPDDGGGDDPGDEDDGEEEEDRDRPPHMPPDRGNEGRGGANHRGRVARSPTPFGGANPPHAYYYRQGAATPPQLDILGVRHGTPSVNSTRHGADTDWIRETLRERITEYIPELPVIRGLKITQPESYNGSDDLEVFEEWLARVCRWMRLTGAVGPEQDRARVDLLGTVLSSTAQHWYNSVVDGPHRIERSWSFENAVVALYYRFIHQSTMLTATERFENVKYSKPGGARQLATEMGKHAGRMVQPPDEYTIRRRFWFCLPKDITRIMGTIKGLSAERSTFTDLIEAAAEIEDAYRAEQIGERMRQSQSITPQHGSSSGGQPPTANSQSRSNSTRPARPNSFGRNRVRFSDRTAERGPERRTADSTQRPASGPPRPANVSSKPQYSGANASTQDKGKQPRRGCFNCGSLTHWANDPACPENARRAKPAVRRISDGGNNTDAAEDEGVSENDDHPKQSSNTEAAQSEEGELEGSQYDPEEYPEELYDSYPEEEESEQWMGGMQVSTTDGEDEHFDCEWLGGMQIATYNTGTDGSHHSADPLDGEAEDPDLVVFDIGLPILEYMDDVVLPQRIVQDFRTPGSQADQLSRTFMGLPQGTNSPPRPIPDTYAAYEVELSHLRQHSVAMNRRLTHLQRRVLEANGENEQLTRINALWLHQCGELNAEVRAFCNAHIVGVSSDQMTRMVADCQLRQHQRAIERERTFSRITVESDNDDTDYEDMPLLEDVASHMASRRDLLDRAVRAQGPPERLNAILANRDREYRSAMAPKEVRPQRDFKCITVYVEANGMKGLALLDSGSSIDCVSPEFARVARLPTRPLDKPVGLQLGCVGSRSSINFGSRTQVKIGSHQQKVYLDVVNIDHYDLILGVPFLQQFGIRLDFRTETIVVDSEVIKSLQVGEEVRTAKPVKRAYTGTSAKYQWAEKNQYE